MLPAWKIHNSNVQRVNKIPHMLFLPTLTYLGVAAQHELSLEEPSQGNDGHRSCDDQGHLPAGNERDDVRRYQRHQVLE